MNAARPSAGPALVVGVAILHTGAVLAARRTRPPEAAGRWELPGGKVEPGESPEAAAVREIAEELGCRVTVTGWLDGAAPAGAHELRVAVATLTDGDPTPVEHDEVRWVPAAGLDALDWLEPDRPFLPQLRDHLVAADDGAQGEQTLPGGSVGGAVRVGDTVRRPTGPWTPAVHALLDHLAGLPGVPRVHGTDEQGREVLDHLPGEVVDPAADLLSEARLASLARWTAGFHRHVQGFHHPGPWRFFGVTGTELVAHNDLSPANVCFVGDEVAGVLDWDLAGPSTRLMELAHLAWWGVPLFRETDPRSAARRLDVVARVYGGPGAREILAAVPARVQVAIDGIRGAVRAGDPGMQRLAETGEPAATERRLARFRERLPRLQRELPDGAGEGGPARSLRWSP